ncbi:MAG: hypothetical protein FGM27_06800 [Candidatus Omnitrophica bacterium]|nr:hypothetical protein [Candidatus Omnitrophota bacterium]
MAPEERRLKRGLGDVSRLFKEKPIPQNEWAVGEFFLKCVAVHRPLSSSARPFILALRRMLIEGGMPAELVRIGGNPLTAHQQETRGDIQDLTWEEFESLNRPSLRKSRGLNEGKQVLIFDFDEGEPEHLKRVLPLMDRWIFAVPPTVDGIIESYRMMKGTRGVVSSSLQYCLVFEGPSGDQGLEEVLFEKFSAVLSQRLGIHLVWLGSAANSEDACRFGDRLDLSHFFLRDTSEIDAFDKQSLFEHLRLLKGVQESFLS